MKSSVTFIHATKLQTTQYCVSTDVIAKITNDLRSIKVCSKDPLNTRIWHWNNDLGRKPHSQCATGQTWIALIDPRTELMCAHAQYNQCQQYQHSQDHTGGVAVSGRCVLCAPYWYGTHARVRMNVLDKNYK